MMIAGLVYVADEGSVDIYYPRYYTMHLNQSTCDWHTLVWL